MWKSHGVKVKSKQSQNTSELIFLRDTLHPNWSVSSAGLQRILFCSIELFKISGILWGTGGLKINRSHRALFLFFFTFMFWAVLLSSTRNTSRYCPIYFIVIDWLLCSFIILSIILLTIYLFCTWILCIRVMLNFYRTFYKDSKSHYNKSVFHWKKLWSNI